jgi:hypothetical protein
MIWLNTHALTVVRGINAYCIKCAVNGNMIISEWELAMMSH